MSDDETRREDARIEAFREREERSGKGPQPVPEPGYEYRCGDCGEACKVTWQDISPYPRPEMAWRSDCCGHLVDEVPREGLYEPPA